MSRQESSYRHPGRSPKADTSHQCLHARQPMYRRATPWHWGGFADMYIPGRARYSRRMENSDCSAVFSGRIHHRRFVSSLASAERGLGWLARSLVVLYTSSNVGRAHLYTLMLELLRNGTCAATMATDLRLNLVEQKPH